MKRFSQIFSLASIVLKSKSKAEAKEEIIDKDLYGNNNGNDLCTCTEIEGTPQLPLELWQYIIELVCCLPIAPSTSSPDPFTTGTHYHVIPRDTEQSSKWNCGNLQLVCRAWRVIALKLAYERLVLCCAQHMVLLLRTLEESKLRDPDGLGYGRWVREVETRRTSCPSDAGEDQEKLKAELRVFAVYTMRTLRCFPNLQIYINKNGWAKPLGLNTYRAVMETLGTICGPSLLRLQWTASESPRWDDLRLLLTRTPSLRSLSLLFIDFDHTNSGGDALKPLADRCALPHLNQLNLGPFPSPSGAEIPYWDRLLEFLMPPRDTHTSSGDLPLPALRSLSITPVNLLSSDTPTERFFTLYGHQLERLATLDLAPRELLSKAEMELLIKNRALRTLLSLCPHIHTLILNPLQPLQLQLSHAQLERIALFPPHESWYEIPEHFYEGIQQPVSNVFEEVASGSFPRLKTLRLRDRGLLGCLGTEDSREWLEEWEKRFERRGIRFENGDGIRFMLTIEDSMEYMPDGI